ncbi:MAG TPA: site-2 protease family protein [Armatimonadota bacterium]|nr:site-2 protease family protein [Armatimonadota bacterium]
MVTLLQFIQAPGELLPEFLSFLIAILVALTVHEFAHAKAAQKAGDPTAEQAGRVTLNPFAHFDPIGTTMILIGGFGWGKPVPVNPTLFKRPRLDNILVSLWGPLSNFITATTFAIPLKFGIVPEGYEIVLIAIVYMNLVLGIFNLIPIYPLDGSHILIGLLPLVQARKVEEFYHRFGIFALIIVIMSGVTRYIVGLPVLIIFALLTTPFGS